MQERPKGLDETRCTVDEYQAMERWRRERTLMLLDAWKAGRNPVGEQVENEQATKNARQGELW